MDSIDIKHDLVFNFPAGNSLNLGVRHHSEVIGIGATYIPTGLVHLNLSSPHLLVPFLQICAVRL